MSASKIHFGGKSWNVQPLTWDQLARIYPDLAAVYRSQGIELINTRLRVIVTALDGQASEEDLRKLPTDFAEIYKASEEIGVLSGFVKLGELMTAKMGSPLKAGQPSSPLPAPAPDGPPAKLD